MSNRQQLTILTILIAGSAVFFMLRSGSQESPTGQPMVSVAIPELSGEAKIGEELFRSNCSVCHGANAAGKASVGPPLIHKIYEPGHHGDGSFYNAVQNGVRGHHWPFGDMAPVEGVSEEEVTRIIRYIRTLQRANDIN